MNQTKSESGIKKKKKFFFLYESYQNQLRIEFFFSKSNRINSVSLPKQVSFPNLIINSESNANRFFKTNQIEIDIKCKSIISFQIKSIPNQMRIDISNRINSKSNANRFFKKTK